MVTIDFETRSEVDLKKAGPWVYAESETTEVLCMAYKVNNGDTDIWFPSLDADPDDKSVDRQMMEHRISAGIEFMAHNAEFERAVWHHIMHKRFGWPDIPISQWIDSAAMAAAMALPRALEKVCSVLNLKNQKDTDGHKLMLKYCKPKRLQYDDKWHNVPDELRRLYAYCMADVDAEYELFNHPSVYPLSERERAVWELDQKINETGIYIDRETVKAAKKLIFTWEKELNSELKRLTGGEVEKGTQRDRILRWLNSQNVKMSSLTALKVEQLLNTPLSAQVKCVLEIRQSLSRTSTKKLQAMLDRLSADGRARSTTMYHAASTGRWGGKAIQPHNMPRGTVKDQDGALTLVRKGDLKGLKAAYGEDPMSTISSCLRGMICAAPGRVLRVADYSAIEARGLAWLAGQTDLLAMFAGGLDPYVDIAADIYKTEDWLVDEKQRDIGKRVILGAGYQMSGSRFRSMVIEQRGPKLPEQFCNEVIELFRRKYAKIRQFWWDMERAATDAIKTKQPQRVGKITFGLADRYLHMTLPSGRRLSYYRPSVENRMKPWGEPGPTICYWGVDSTTHQWKEQTTYSGKLVENATQAVARDAEAWAMKRVDRAGYNVVFHVHDEIVSEDEPSFGSLEEFTQLMAQVPTWANGFPVKVEGWEGERYRK